MTRTWLATQKTANGYKQFRDAPIRYAGGKSRGVGIILEHLPANIQGVLSPFIGGGSVEVAIAKHLNLKVEASDVFDVLTIFWNELLNNKQALIESLSRIEISRESFNESKETLKRHWQGEIKLEDNQVAALYFYTHNTSYGPGFLGWPSSVYLNDTRWKSMVAKLSQFDCHNLRVENKDFKTALSHNQELFVYADPPYFLGGQSKMFKGMYPQRNFPIHHNGFDHELLAEMLLSRKSGFLLSYNDCPEIRELYKDCEIYTPSWLYSMGQGETRIGKNRQDSGSYVKKSHELLIRKLPNV